MNTETLVNKIKSKGYWRVEIRPTIFDKQRVPNFSEVRELIQSCTVLWRGWDYPHWNAKEIRNMSDWVESSEDWESYIEYWRFYRSGQFIHLFALHEDHIDIDNILPQRYPPRSPRAGYVSFISTTYKVTEIFEFAARLANRNVLTPSAFISIGLHNMRDHELTSFNANRFMDDGFVYEVYEPIVIEREIEQQQLVSNPDNIALDFIVAIFERFNWINPSRQILAEDQKRLRKRRL